MLKPKKILKTVGYYLYVLLVLLPKNGDNFYDLVHFTADGAEKVSEIIFAALEPSLRNQFPEFVK